MIVFFYTLHASTVGNAFLFLNVFSTNRIVRAYLQHYGYEDTLKTFDVESRSTLPPISFVQENGFAEDVSVYSLNQRKVLRQV